MLKNYLRTKAFGKRDLVMRQFGFCGFHPCTYHLALVYYETLQLRSGWMLFVPIAEIGLTVLTCSKQLHFVGCQMINPRTRFSHQNYV